MKAQKVTHTVVDLLGATVPGRVLIVFTEPKKLSVEGPVNNCSCAGQCLYPLCCESAANRNGRDREPIKLYLQNRWRALWPEGGSLLSP